MSSSTFKLSSFPFERQFQVFGILHGQLVGHDIVVRPFLRRFSYILRYGLFLCGLRWTIAAFFTNNLSMSFYLYNMSYTLSPPLAIYNLWMCALFAYWCCFSVINYSRLNRSFRLRFWMYLVPWNEATGAAFKQPSSLTRDEQLRRLGVDADQYDKCIEKFFKYSTFVKNCAFYPTLVCGLLFIVSYHLSFGRTSYHFQYYSLVFAINAFSMVMPIIGGVLAFSIPFIFIYLCIMFQIKFKTLHIRIDRLICRYPSNNRLFRRHLQLLNHLIRQLNIVNLYWDSILGYNYLFSISMSAIALIMLFESGDLIVFFTYILAFELNFLIIFALPVIVCGNFNNKVYFFPIKICDLIYHVYQINLEFRS